MLIFWSLVRNSVVLAVYLLFSVACFLTVHEHTTRRSNGRSCSRTRAASHPGGSGPSTTSRDRPRGAGVRTKAGMIRANTARYPISARCRMPGVPRSIYYWMTGHPGTERADCVSASWCPQYGHFFQQRRRLVSNRNRAVGTRRPFLPGYLVMRACPLR